MTRKLTKAEAGSRVCVNNKNCPAYVGNGIEECLCYVDNPYMHCLQVCACDHCHNIERCNELIKENM